MHEWDTSIGWWNVVTCQATHTHTHTDCRTVHTFTTNMLLSLILLLSTFAAVTKSRTQDNFYFDPAPIDAEVTEGNEARLRCDVSNRKHITFYWTLNDKPVVNTSRRFQEDSDLRILRVNREEDVGSFRCIATNVTTGVSLRSIEARLNIFCKYQLFHFAFVFLSHNVYTFDIWCTNLPPGCVTESNVYLNGVLNVQILR